MASPPALRLTRRPGLRHSRRIVALGTVTAAIAALTWGATPAWASDRIVGVSPEIGSTLSQQPGKVSITFSAPIGGIDPSATVSVIGPDQKHYETSCPIPDGDTVTVAASLGIRGTYTVSWVLPANADHDDTARGSYTFGWQPAADTMISAGTSTGPFCGIASSTPSTTARSTPSAVTLTPTVVPSSATVAAASSGASTGTGSPTTARGSAEEGMLPVAIFGIIAVVALSVATALLRGTRREANGESDHDARP